MKWSSSARWRGRFNRASRLLHFTSSHLIRARFYTNVWPIAGRITTQHWDLYDTRHAVFHPARLSAETLETGYWRAYRDFYRGDRSSPAHRPTPAQSINCATSPMRAAGRSSSRCGIWSSAPQRAAAASAAGKLPGWIWRAGHITIRYDAAGNRAGSVAQSSSRTSATRRASACQALKCSRSYTQSLRFAKHFR